MDENDECHWMEYGQVILFFFFFFLRDQPSPKQTSFNSNSPLEYLQFLALHWPFSVCWLSQFFGFFDVAATSLVVEGEVQAAVALDQRKISVVTRPDIFG
jgi:hypothetical protein